MATGRITKRTVDALSAGPRDCFLWDASLRGFGVKVTPQGRKTYLAQVRVDGGRGTTRRYTIGVHGAPWTPDLARAEAVKVLSAASRGEDLMASRMARRTEPTVDALIDRYIAEHVRIHNKPSTRIEVERLCEKLIRPALGRLRLSKVTRSTVRQWHAANAHRRVSANRALAALSKAFELAVTVWDIASENPCCGAAKHREAARERVFTDAEFVAFGEALAGFERDGARPATLLAIRLAALTGMRIGELLDAQWRDINLATGVLLLRDAKAGARTVALPAVACALLEASERCGDFVLQDAIGRVSYHAVYKLWRRACDRAGLEGVRIHDLRHSVATAAARAGASALVVRDLLGHKTLAMANRYVARNINPVRAVADIVGDRFAASMAANSAGAEVVHLHAAHSTRKSSGGDAG